ncbi:hypothetical protein J8J40_20550, partial [Mycobacterium tuberculosis]|nr:hypothetical protein [Mycobacterium tuberculosis]
MLSISAGISMQPLLEKDECHVRAAAPPLSRRDQAMQINVVSNNIPALACVKRIATARLPRYL